MPMKLALWGRSSTTRSFPLPERESSRSLVSPTSWMSSRTCKEVEGQMRRPSMMFALHWLMGALSSSPPSLTCGQSRTKGTKMKQHLDISWLKLFTSFEALTPHNPIAKNMMLVLPGPCMHQCQATARFPRRSWSAITMSATILVAWSEEQKPLLNLTRQESQDPNDFVLRSLWQWLKSPWSRTSY